MRAGLVITSKGVERAVSIGEGPKAMDACLELVALIRPEIDEFHRAIVAKFAQLHEEPGAGRRRVAVTS